MDAHPPGPSQSVSLRHVLKKFGSFLAVRDLSLEVAAGEFVTLLGPSGCGKTTTLRMIAGLMPQDGGEIRFGDRRVDLLPANRRNVGLVFQNYALFPHMTVAENIGFGLRMRGWPKAKQQAQIDRYLALVRLEGLAGRKPGQLSGGQQQRVAVARALAFGPDLVLLDEPLSNLDAKLREQVRIDLRAIQREARQTTLFVTHDQVEALAMSDRVVLMNQGEIEQIGAPQELYTRPATEFAARFIGANNLIAGQLVEGGEAPRVAIEGQDIALRASSSAGAVGQTVWLCVRPEQVKISAIAEGPPDAVAARLTDMIFQGGTMLVEAAAPGIGKLRAECPPAEVAQLRPGDAVMLSLDGGHVVAR